LDIVKYQQINGNMKIVGLLAIAILLNKCRLTQVLKVETDTSDNIHVYREVQ